MFKLKTETVVFMRSIDKLIEINGTDCTIHSFIQENLRGGGGGGGGGGEEEMGIQTENADNSITR